MEALIFLAQLDQAAFRWSNVQEANGVAIAVLGMTIVFAALMLISMFIAALPRILEWGSRFAPQIEDTHDAPSPAESTAADERMVIAAIGYALHTQMQKAMQK